MASTESSPEEIRVGLEGFHIPTKLESPLRTTSFQKETFLFDHNSQFYDIIETVSKSLPHDIYIRSLSSLDFHRNYMELLTHLTVVGNVTENDYLKRFSSMKSSGDYFIFVLANSSTEEIVGSASLILEQKFIHSCKTRARIEDVVVLPKYRGKGFGQLLLELLVKAAELLGSYKLSLECKDSLMKFYQRFGFRADQNFMVLRFSE